MATLTCLIGIIGFIVSVLLFTLDVPSGFCDGCAILSMSLISGGCMWASFESFFSNDILRQKMMESAGNALWGLIALDVIIHYCSYHFFDYLLTTDFVIWYAIPLLIIYLLGAMGYLVALIEKIRHTSALQK